MTEISTSRSQTVESRGDRSIPVPNMADSGTILQNPRSCLRTTAPRDLWTSAKWRGDSGENLCLARGLAFGDIDRDGDLDMVLQNIDNTLRIYRNDAPRPTRIGCSCAQ